MNKNIKFFNFSNAEIIKILAEHNKLDSLPIKPVQKPESIYAISTVESLEKVISNIYNDLLVKYNAKNSPYNIKNNFIINIYTMTEDPTLDKITSHKIGEYLEKIPFKSTKDVFIDAHNFTIHLTLKDLNTPEKEYLKNLVQKITCSEFHAFSQNSNKEILEFIGFVNYSDIGGFQINLKIRKHSLDKNKKYMVLLDIYSISLQFLNKNIIENIFDEPFDTIYKTIQNITKFLDYNKRDISEKNIFDNIENEIVYNIPKNLKFTNSLLKNKEDNIILQNTSESIENFYNADDIILNAYKNYKLDKNDELIIEFTTDNKLGINEKAKIQVNDLLDEKEIMLHSDGYGMSIFPTVDNRNENELSQNALINRKLDEIVIEKHFILTKTSRDILKNNKPISSNYKINMFINTKMKRLKFCIDWSIEDYICLKNAIGDLKSKMCLVSLEFDKYIDPVIYYFADKNNISKKIAENEIKTIFTQEIENEINKIISSGKTLDPNDKNPAYDLINILFNKTIFMKIICDVEWLENNRKKMNT